MYTNWFFYMTFDITNLFTTKNLGFTVG